jgi:hypothetical protein
MSSLAAARADNFYYPPNYDPAKHGSLNKVQQAASNQARLSACVSNRLGTALRCHSEACMSIIVTLLGQWHVESWLPSASDFTVQPGTLSQP